MPACLPRRRVPPLCYFVVITTNTIWGRERRAQHDDAARCGRRKRGLRRFVAARLGTEQPSVGTLHRKFEVTRWLNYALLVPLAAVSTALWACAAGAVQFGWLLLCYLKRDLIERRGGDPEARIDLLTDTWFDDLDVLLPVTALVWLPLVLALTTFGIGLGRRLLGTRYDPATGENLQRLDDAWRLVSKRAGREPIPVRFEVMLDDDDVNACVPSERVVAVTRGALTRLTDDELAALLAHEMGHLVAGEGWATPTRTLMMMTLNRARRIARTMARDAADIAASAFPIGGLLGLALSVAQLALAAAVKLVSVALHLVMLLGSLRALTYWVVRRNEMHADRFAARCGFAATLMDVFAKMPAEFDESFDTHSSARRRSERMLRALERDNRRMDRQERRYLERQLALPDSHEVSVA